MRERHACGDTEVAVGERPLKPSRNPDERGFLLGKMCKKPNGTSGKLAHKSGIICTKLAHFLGIICTFGGGRSHRTTRQTVIERVDSIPFWHYWPSDFMPFWHIEMSENMP